VSIALQGNGSNNGTTVTVPTHAVGDLLIFHASNHASATTPTRPSDIVSLFSLSNAGGSVLCGYKHALTNSETSGTWTNATNLFVTVWRGDTNTIVMPEFVSTNGGTAANINYPVQPAGTFRTGANDIALLAYVLNSSITNTLLPPGALANLQDATDAATWQAKQYYQLARTTAWANTSVLQAGNNYYRSLLLSLFEEALPSTGGAGVFNPIEHSLLG
jgi:hypothetical protein